MTTIPAAALVVLLVALGAFGVVAGALLNAAI